MFRLSGWAFLGLALMVVSVISVVGALEAHGDAAFNHWVGWATVAAVPVAAVGVLLVIGDKFFHGAASPRPSDEDTEDELAAVVITQAQEMRSRLLGIDEVNDEAANVRFIKGPGRFREAGGASEGDLSSILNYYQSLHPRRLVVLGDPGTGKTVLVIELLIQMLERRQHDSGISLPVMISASAYDTRFAWEIWLAEHLALRFNIGSNAAAKLVRDGRILPIVDGIDEMDTTGTFERADALVAALNSYMHGRDRAAVIVTCRRTDYLALAKHLDRATHIEMVPLTGTEAADYLSGQFINEEEHRRWAPVLAELRSSPDGMLASQLATPWRLTLGLAAFREAGDPTELFPRKSDLSEPPAREYTRRLDALLLGSYVPSAVRLYDPTGRYPVERVQRWLTVLADGLAWQGRNGRSATDIQLVEWWRPAAGRFAHLAHLALAAAPGVAWLIYGAAKGERFVLLLGAMIAVAGGAMTIRRPSASRLNLHGITGPRLGAFIRSAANGIPVGIVIGITAGVQFGLADGIYSGIISGVTFGIFAGMAIGLEETSPQAIGPQDFIRADGIYGLVVGIMGGIAISVGAGTVIGFRLGLAAGITFAITEAAAFGANAWVRYHLTNVISALRQDGPPRFGSFLDWAQQAGLLRVSGVAYQFRHRQLQDWLESHR
jgi:hypothetical protein